MFADKNITVENRAAATREAAERIRSDEDRSKYGRKGELKNPSCFSRSSKTHLNPGRTTLGSLIKNASGSGDRGRLGTQATL